MNINELFSYSLCRGPTLKRAEFKMTSDELSIKQSEIATKIEEFKYRVRVENKLQIAHSLTTSKIFT